MLFLFLCMHGILLFTSSAFYFLRVENIHVKTSCTLIVPPPFPEQTSWLLSYVFSGDKQGSHRRKVPNIACTGRLGLCAFFEIVLSFDRFPFPSLFLPSRR